MTVGSLCDWDMQQASSFFSGRIMVVCEHSRRKGPETAVGWTASSYCVMCTYTKGDEAIILLIFNIF